MIEYKGWLFLALITLFLWGLYGFFGKIATKYIDPKSVVLYYSAGAALVGVFLYLFGFRFEFHPTGSTFAILTGLAGVIGSVLFIFAISKGRASIVTPLIALYPMITIALAYFILKEPVTIKQGLGIIFALGALVLFSI